MKYWMALSAFYASGERARRTAIGDVWGMGLLPVIELAGENKAPDAPAAAE